MYDKFMQALHIYTRIYIYIYIHIHIYIVLMTLSLLTADCQGDIGKGSKVPKVSMGRYLRWVDSGS